MKIITVPTFIFAVFIASLLAGCSGSIASLAGDWSLVSYGEAPSPIPALAGVDTSINFNEGQFGGNVGCNSFGGDYKVNGDKIEIGSVMSTMMFCEQTSAQESAVLAIFSGSTLTFELVGDQLTLTSADGSSVVVLVRK